MLLLTEEKLRDSDWPRDAIDEFYYVRRDMPSKTSVVERPIWRVQSASIASSRSTTSTSRWRRRSGNTFSCPAWAKRRRGGFATSWQCAGARAAAGIPCPPFVHTLNDGEITRWISEVPAPWVLKPRSQAAALGIRRLGSADELWSALILSATIVRATCWSSSFPGTSFTSTRLSSTSRCSFPAPASTRRRRSSWRTTPVSSSPGRSRRRTRRRSRSPS